MPDLNKLNGIMLEKGKTYAEGAKIIGCSRTAFSAKMNAKSSFSVKEANDLSDALELSAGERVTIFLT